MRRQRWHALGTWGLGRISSVAAVEQNLAFLIPPDKVAPALQVSHAAPSMTVQRNYISRRNAGMKNAYLFVFQQELMVRWRSGERIKRVWPRPELRVSTNWVLAHAIPRMF